MQDPRPQDDEVTEDAWSSLADRFVDGHYGSLRGRVRTYVIDRHLHAHLPPLPARSVDVGGGAGNQSIPLAQEGYEVTIVDPSVAMLKRAEEVLAQQSHETQGRVRLVRSSAEDAPTELGYDRFDVPDCLVRLSHLSPMFDPHQVLPDGRP